MDEVWLVDSSGNEIADTRVGPFDCSSGQSRMRLDCSAAEFGACGVPDLGASAGACEPEAPPRGFRLQPQVHHQSTGRPRVDLQSPPVPGVDRAHRQRPKLDRFRGVRSPRSTARDRRAGRGTGPRRERSGRGRRRRRELHDFRLSRYSGADRCARSGQRRVRHGARLQLHHAQQVLRVRPPAGLDRQHEPERYGARRRIQLGRGSHHHLVPHFRPSTRRR